MKNSVEGLQDAAIRWGSVDCDNNSHAIPKVPPGGSLIVCRLVREITRVWFYRIPGWTLVAFSYMSPTWFWILCADPNALLMMPSCCATIHTCMSSAQGTCMSTFSTVTVRLFVSRKKFDRILKDLWRQLHFAKFIDQACMVRKKKTLQIAIQPTALPLCRSAKPANNVDWWEWSSHSLNTVLCPCHAVAKLNCSHQNQSESFATGVWSLLKVLEDNKDVV